MNKRITTYSIVFLAVIFSACGDSPTGEAPPIKMGDPATIVTETDTQYLADVVNDMNIASRPLTIIKKETAPANDSAGTTAIPDSGAIAVTGAGLNVPFPQVRFFIPGIDTRTYKEPNLETDFGASYELVAGELQGSKLTVEGVQIENVYMRYQTIVVARNENGTLPLESLRKLTDWKKIKGKNNIYKIDGLQKNKIEGINVSNKAIRNAVTRATRSMRLSRNATSDWTNSLRRANSTTKKPLGIELRSVMWKVTGKDANGRPFQRQLRIDIPIES